MIAPLLAALVLQTAPLEHRLFCVADPASGDIEVTLLFRNPDGGPWRTAQNSREGEVVDVDRLPQAAGLDWYEAGEPIVHEGVAYHRGGSPFSVGGAVNRYLRQIGMHRGAPLSSVWPGGDIDLAVLVRAENCVFQVYAREDRAGG